MEQNEKIIEKQAIELARARKKEIARKWTDPERFPPEEEPVSVFMAGCPGAGKTEASIELLESLDGNGSPIIRIDPDELRDEFPGYTGGNSWLFQAGVSILVEKIHDLALKQKQSFLLDGTLTNYRIAEQNVKRSLKKGRFVQILYVYQEPKLAWEFVKAREQKEGRNIRPEDFVRQYFAAREVVNRLKGELGKELRVDLLVKDHDGSHKAYKAGIDKIDNHLPEKYDPESLEKLLGLR
ncbi:putative ABC-type ATPase [Natronospira proteinivora]|uniref:ABC-type ATPase n=1 Tax=Natronospira proteinivora TaxID=1807133 RepID=A0ABT1GAT1_9GAMM|nr:putative ABC-type ATPase [Natronospira proteinivora]